jgi:hypothetical protein
MPVDINRRDAWDPRGEQAQQTSRIKDMMLKARNDKSVVKAAKTVRLCMICSSSPNWIPLSRRQVAKRFSVEPSTAANRIVKSVEICNS